MDVFYFYIDRIRVAGSLRQVFFIRRTLYLVVVTGISALRGLIVAVATVGELKLLTFAPQRVDAALEIDIEPRAVIDCQRLLRRYVRVRRIDRIPQALLEDL